jgi:MotA/TolQ/ExbB proton channel family protein
VAIANRSSNPDYPRDLLRRASVSNRPANGARAELTLATDTERLEARADAQTPLSGDLAPHFAFLSRFVVLQAIGATFVITLWIAGLADKPFEGPNAPLCWLIVAIAALGLTCVLLRRWRDVQWLATHVVRLGLLGTVVGLIIAFSAARHGGSTDANEVKAMIASVVDGMYVSLYATLLGITTNLWLKINLRLLGQSHG